MSIPAVGPVGPAVSAEPAAARTPDARTVHAAKAFERVMLEQLTKEMAASAAPEDAGDGASAATNAYRDMLPAAMADALSQSGGIGIATQLQATLAAAKATVPADAPSTDVPPAGAPSAGTPSTDAPGATPGVGALPTGVAS
jgi:Rod binding domain-containing protein